MPSVRKSVQEQGKRNWATQIQIVMISWTLRCFKTRLISSSFHLILSKICHSTRQNTAKTVSRKPSNSSLVCYRIRLSRLTSHRRAPGRVWYRALLLVLDKDLSMMEHTQVQRELRVAPFFDLNLNLNS